MQTKNITFHKTPPGKSAYLTKMTYSRLAHLIVYAIVSSKLMSEIASEKCPPMERFTSLTFIYRKYHVLIHTSPQIIIYIISAINTRYHIHMFSCANLIDRNKCKNKTTCIIPLHSLLLSFIIIQKIYDHRPIPVSAVYVIAGIFQPL